MKSYFLRRSSPFAVGTLLLGLPASHARASLIANGDFEAGHTGFTSAYQYVPPGGSSLYPEAVYTVDSNPHNSHNLFYNLGDHTTGQGEMMIINGSSTIGIPVWMGSSTVALTVGQEYDFSAWVASAYPASPARLTFMVGSQMLGMSSLSPDPDGSWKRLFGTFVAFAEFPDFWLINANGDGFGNDFAIDDIDIYVPGTTSNPTTSVPDSGPGYLASFTLLGLCGAQYLKTRNRSSVKS